jgi:hypothetical protein
VTAHVLLEDFDVLKPKRISISVHSIKLRDFCDETHIPGGAPAVVASIDAQSVQRSRAETYDKSPGVSSGRSEGFLRDRRTEVVGVR